MTAPDRGLAALIAAFVPARAAELSAYLAPPRGAAVRSAAEALLRGGRSARLAELARALGPREVARGPAAAAGEACVARAIGGGGRLRERLLLEAAAARSGGPS